MVVRKYRTKLEVLRAVLTATRTDASKTRIIGAANLNPDSFRRYLGFALRHGLLVEHNGRYRATPRAALVEEAIDEVLDKASQLELALRSLERSVAREPRAPERSEPLRLVARLAWQELLFGPEAAMDSLPPDGGSHGPGELGTSSATRRAVT